jgi:N-acetyl-gamma-glutamylphosphate reductase
LELIKKKKEMAISELEKQEMEEVVREYGILKHKYWDELHEIYRQQKEREIVPHIGEMQIADICRELERSNERLKFVELTKKLDNEEYEKYFRSACLREFLDIHILPQDL